VRAVLCAAAVRLAVEELRAGTTRPPQNIRPPQNSRVGVPPSTGSSKPVM
jgi:hypothetical protein